MSPSPYHKCLLLIKQQPLNRTRPFLGNTQSGVEGVGLLGGAAFTLGGGGGELGEGHVSASKPPRKQEVGA